MLENLIAIVVLGLGVGGLAALAALAFVESVLWLNDLLLISPRSRIVVHDTTFLAIVTVAVPTLGGLLVGCLCAALPGRRALGPSDVILATHRSTQTLAPREGAITTSAALVSLGVGASVGQYGPLVHLGSTLGAGAGRWLGTSRYFATVGIGCGAAAAIATAFNAPIAGLVFAHEVILRHYSVRAFAPIAVAATIGYVVSSKLFERAPLFRIDAFDIGNPAEYLLFIVIGAAGALIAITFMHLIAFAARVGQRVPVPSVLKPALAGLVIGVVGIELTEVLGIGKTLLRFAVIDHAFDASELAVLLSAKIVLTALCLGLGFVGGVFSPSVVIGILFGALAGLGAEAVLGDVRSPIAIYAICGMVAVTSPVIGAPLTTILIVFELTRNYDLAIAAILSVAIANLLGYRWFGRSLFDRQLLARGIDLSLGRDKVIVEEQTIEALTSSDYTRVDARTPLAQVRQRLLDRQHSEAYVVDAAGRYLGTVSLHHLEQSLDRGHTPSTPAHTVAQPEALILAPQVTLWEALSRLDDFVGESIPVVHEERLLGVVFESSIVRTYLHTLEHIRKEENAAT